ncbi:transcription modulator YdgT [Erwinia aphidicola]|jgi:S-adenosylmethionine:diacylglycerol 3-amino-3-carboxypropyl transferase|nr:oriC-binding nucleoid-associated protein [Erwinia sp. OLMDLW33]CAH0136551.1 OriC-binding nucleoid-associated protein [Erwinia aphidicola]
MANMTAQDYLLKFRKVNSLETLEKLFDHLNYSLNDDGEIIQMYRAADHRRAELVSGGRLFDLGRVPKTVWRYVV